MIEHRKYLLYYGEDSWVYGFWMSIFKNPPCKKPGSPKNKEYDFELEISGDEMKEIYLNLIGDSFELDEIEKQIAKYKLARVEKNQSLTIIYEYEPMPNLYMYKKFCSDKNYCISGRIIVPPK